MILSITPSKAHIRSETQPIQRVGAVLPKTPGVSTFASAPQKDKAQNLQDNDMMSALRAQLEHHYAEKMKKLSLEGRALETSLKNLSQTHKTSLNKYMENLAKNLGGESFWSSIGFEHYYYMADRTLGVLSLEKFSHLLRYFYYSYSLSSFSMDVLGWLFPKKKAPEGPNFLSPLTAKDLSQDSLAHIVRLNPDVLPAGMFGMPGMTPKDIQDIMQSLMAQQGTE